MHHEVIAKIFSFAQEIGFGVMAIDFSPIKGPEGNIEYLVYIKKGEESLIELTEVQSVVDKAHETLT